MISFIDENRKAYGIEPICHVLKIAPSTFHAHDARRRRPGDAPPRVMRDAALKPVIQRIFDENFQVYGVRKVWRQLLREGFGVARCTVARLMKVMVYKNGNRLTAAASVVRFRRRRVEAAVLVRLSPFVWRLVLKVRR